MGLGAKELGGAPLVGALQGQERAARQVRLQLPALQGDLAERADYLLEEEEEEDDDEGGEWWWRKGMRESRYTPPLSHLSSHLQAIKLDDEIGGRRADVALAVMRAAQRARGVALGKQGGAREDVEALVGRGRGAQRKAGQEAGLVERVHGGGVTQHHGDVRVGVGVGVVRGRGVRYPAVLAYQGVEVERGQIEREGAGGWGRWK